MLASAYINVKTDVLSHNLIFYARKSTTLWTYQVIITAPLSADTFFFMSGLLVSYSLIPRAGQIHGVGTCVGFWTKYAIHRIIRLTPSYLLVLILYTGLFNHAYDGPLYPQQPELTDVIYCRNHWWVTYLNNFIHSTEPCMPWTWYLANEFQFSIFLAPIFVTLVSWFPPAGILFSICLILSAIGATFGISYSNDFLPVLINSEALDKIYTKPYTRWDTYAIGLLVGWCLHSNYRLPSWSTFRKSALIAALGLSLASVFCLSTVYGLYGFVSGQIEEMPTWLSAFYNAMHRPVFTLGVAIITLLCAKHYIMPIRSFLSWSAFYLLSRLSYGVYLIHPIVIMYFTFGSQSPVLMDNLFTVVQFLAVLVVSYLGAFILSLVTESPLSFLEPLLFRR